jgi:hypothetical protein
MPLRILPGPGPLVTPRSAAYEPVQVLALLFPAAALTLLRGSAGVPAAEGVEQGALGVWG